MAHALTASGNDIKNPIVHSNLILFRTVSLIQQVFWIRRMEISIVYFQLFASLLLLSYDEKE